MTLPHVDHANGVTGVYNGPSTNLKIVIGALAAVAMSNAIELNVLVFGTFKVYRGLYFWSLLVASWGVVLYASGFIFKFFGVTTNLEFIVAYVAIGWTAMVTGQAVVLWSRLHLVVQNEKLLRGLLWMIIINAIIFHIPTTATAIGVNLKTSSVLRFAKAYNVLEKFSMTGFCLQEFILSGLYLHESIKFLKQGFDYISTSASTKSADQIKSRQTLHFLTAINIIIISMDLVLLGLEFSNQYIMEISLKAVVYSLKLKLEFAVLGQLKQYVKRPSQVSTDLTLSEFVDVEKSAFALPPTRKPSSPTSSSGASQVSTKRPAMLSVVGEDDAIEDVEDAEAPTASSSKAPEHVGDSYSTFASSSKALEHVDNSLPTFANSKARGHVGESFPTFISSEALKDIDHSFPSFASSSNELEEADDSFPTLVTRVSDNTDNLLPPSPPPKKAVDPLEVMMRRYSVAHK